MSEVCGSKKPDFYTWVENQPQIGDKKQSVDKKLQAEAKKAREERLAKDMEQVAKYQKYMKYKESVDKFFAGGLATAGIAMVSPPAALAVFAGTIVASGCNDETPSEPVGDGSLPKEAEKAVENSILTSIDSDTGGSKVRFKTRIMIKDDFNGGRLLKIATQNGRLLVDGTGFITVAENPSSANCAKILDQNCTFYGAGFDGRVVLGGRSVSMDGKKVVLANPLTAKLEAYSYNGSATAKILAREEKQNQTTGKTIYKWYTQEGLDPEYYIDYSNKSKKIAAGFYLCDKDGNILCKSTGNPAGKCNDSDISASSVVRFSGNANELIASPAYRYWEVEMKDASNVSNFEYKPGVSGDAGSGGKNEHVPADDNEEQGYTALLDRTKVFGEVLKPLPGTTVSEKIEGQSYPVVITGLNFIPLDASGAMKIGADKKVIRYSYRDNNGSEVLNYRLTDMNSAYAFKTPDALLQLGAGNYILEASGYVDRTGMVGAGLAHSVVIRTSLKKIPAGMDQGALPVYSDIGQDAGVKSADKGAGDSKSLEPKPADSAPDSAVDLIQSDKLQTEGGNNE